MKDRRILYTGFACMAGLASQAAAQGSGLDRRAVSDTGLPQFPLVVETSAPARAAEAADSIPAGSPQIAVLGYGKVSGSGAAGTLSATAFSRQMDYLMSHGLRPISLQSYLDWKEGKRSLPPRSVLITLDDADRETCELAGKVLADHHYPSVVFVDKRNFGAGSAGRATLEQLRTMQRNGAEIGCATATRPESYEWQFAALSGDADYGKLAKAELGEPARDIAAAFGSCRAFSFPRGYVDSNISHALPFYGYRAAFGGQGGKVHNATDPMAMNRFMVKDDESFSRAVNFGTPAEAQEVLLELTGSKPAPAPLPAPVEANVPAPAPLHDNLLVPIETEEDTPEYVSPAPALVQLPGKETPAPLPATLPEPEPAGQAAVPAEPAPSTPAVAETNTPATPAQPAIAGLEDDDYAEEVEDEEPAPAVAPAPAPATNPVVQQAEDPAYPAVEPLYAALGKRGGQGDWVTSRFAAPVVPREKTRVAVLGYHNFSNVKQTTEMRMRTSEFCQQMQYIKDAGLSVITMQDFLEWLNGTRCLPERCILITIDDGWKSVYTDAYPVLRAYGYPFTLFLYTTYIGVYGDSMTTRQIDEMRAHGATIGSHSTTHLYPRHWKRYGMESEPYKAQLDKELVQSRQKLIDLFGLCSTYCYPGGYNTPPMVETLRAAKYQAAFTVEEAKATCTENPMLIHRYMVFGVDPSIFRRAVNFDGERGVAPAKAGIQDALPRARQFFPQAFIGATEPAAKPAAAASAKPAAAKGKAKPAAKSPAKAKSHAKPVLKPAAKPATKVVAAKKAATARR